jgi:hypothetical protein
MPSFGRQQSKNEIDALSIGCLKVNWPEKTGEQTNHGFKAGQLRVRNGNAAAQSSAPLSFPREQGIRHQLRVQTICAVSLGGNLLEELLLGADVDSGQNRIVPNKTGDIHQRLPNTHTFFGDFA